MNTAALDAVRDPRFATGPRTDAGKAKSSQNAIRTGLYAARDFVRPGEEEEYAQTLIQLMGELTPDGTLEETFATEIMGANWRLRRCRLVEESFAGIDDLSLDAMIDEKTEKAQRSVDRARAQSHNILRRSIAELRKLQTERTIHEQLADRDIPGLADVKKVASALKMQERENAPAPAPRSAPNALPDFEALMAMADKQLARQYREGGLSAFTINNSAYPDINPVKDAKPLVSAFTSAYPDIDSLKDAKPSVNSDAAATPSAPAGSFCETPAAPGSFYEKPKFSSAYPVTDPIEDVNSWSCPCGSGVKFKRCCGKNAPAVLNNAA